MSTSKDDAATRRDRELRSSAYHHGNVRSTTLSVAREMLDRMPAHDISLREIARAAGLSHAAPYKHFRERSEFLSALAAVCVAELVDAQRCRIAAISDPEQRLLELGAGYVAWGTRNPNAFQLVFDPSTTHPDDELAGQLGEHRDLLVGAIADLTEAGRFRSGDVAAIALSLWSLVHGVTQLVILAWIDVAEVSTILTTALAGW